MENKKESTFHFSSSDLYVRTSVDLINQTLESSKNCLEDVVLIFRKLHDSIKVNDKISAEDKKKEYFDYLNLLMSPHNHI